MAKNKRIQPLLIGHPSPDTYVIDAGRAGTSSRNC
jgi:DNA excision repair protein ERCC-3